MSASLKPQPSTTEPLPGTRAWRTVISLLLALHVLAIFSAPWSGPGPSSELSRLIADEFRPYLKATHQFQGYRFFAPEPGPSHLVHYELKMADGSAVRGRFPNHAEHRPRLLYHRHFMLTESLNDYFMQPVIAEGLPPDANEQTVAEANAVFQAYAKSYAMHLLNRFAAESVTIELIRHELPDPELIRQGIRLDDQRSYRTLYTKTFMREDV